MGHWNGPVLGLVDLISGHHWEIEPDNSKKKERKWDNQGNETPKWDGWRGGFAFGGHHFGTLPRERHGTRQVSLEWDSSWSWWTQFRDILWDTRDGITLKWDTHGGSAGRVGRPSMEHGRNKSESRERERGFAFKKGPIWDAEWDGRIKTVHSLQLLSNPRNWKRKLKKN